MSEKRLVCSTESFSAGLKDVKKTLPKTNQNTSSTPRLTGSFNAGLKDLGQIVAKNKQTNTANKK